jgi:hypothetical protein
MKKAASSEKRAMKDAIAYSGTLKQAISDRISVKAESTHIIMIRTTCLCKFGLRYPLSCRMMDQTETIVAAEWMSSG